MKKILYIITKGNWGGAQRYVFDLATNLPADEFDVAVAMGEGSVLEQKLRHEKVRTIEVPSLQRDISLLKEIWVFFALLRLFKKERPDIVHLNSSKAAALGALGARAAGCKRIVFTVHGWPFLERRGLIARMMILAVSWLTALFSHVVIVVSEHDLRLARRLPCIGKKTVRIYNGIAPLVFGSGERIRNAFPNGARVTGTIGELTKNKNQQALIEAARKNPDLFVAIVGEGELRQELEALIQKHRLESRVKLFGFMPAREAFRGFDAFALPSLKEGLPYVLLEAKQASLPVTANRVGGVGEILDSTDMKEFTLETMLKNTLRVYRR